ncbi:carbohydrate ABC transporter permease [Treponema brennaborense]|uniref:ABC-type transporter, integral membrane subunit n=1 Tax=Treponema brennaborense (strain DSM 12168 / CIP 105900 / DD5/3) TaxID=906968 RepID=F4LNV7_TREBD|nr:carbohydrate ABC transporter permease [Treponema brennaborense]AEE17934.1 ABC-type transporter, integral membrane subunit [Treponema brennaborense DSM 12168]
MINTKHSAGSTSAKIGNSLIWIFLCAFCAVIVLPLVFMVTASFMKAINIMKMPYSWIPKEFYFQNYVRAIAGNDNSFMYVRNIANSLFVAGTITATTILFASLIGFGLAKYKFRGRNVVFLAIMATMMIPFETIMVPLYMVVLNLNIQNTYAGLIIPFMVNAFAVFQMRQYLMTFPEDVLDAARIDGTSEPGIFFRIVFPNCAPAIATLAVLTFRQQWDNLLWPLLVAQSEKMKTIPAYIVKFAAEKYSDEGAMMAVAVIASIPIFILFFGLSKYFVGGSSMYAAGKE